MTSVDVANNWFDGAACYSLAEENSREKNLVSFAVAAWVVDHRKISIGDPGLDFKNPAKPFRRGRR